MLLFVDLVLFAYYFAADFLSESPFKNKENVNKTTTFFSLAQLTHRSWGKRNMENCKHENLL